LTKKRLRLPPSEDEACGVAANHLPPSQSVGSSRVDQAIGLRHRNVGSEAQGRAREAWRRLAGAKPDRPRDSRPEMVRDDLLGVLPRSAGKYGVMGLPRPIMASSVARLGTVYRRPRQRGRRGSGRSGPPRLPPICRGWPFQHLLEFWPTDTERTGLSGFHRGRADARFGQSGSRAGGPTVRFGASTFARRRNPWASSRAARDHGRDRRLPWSRARQGPRSARGGRPGMPELVGRSAPRPCPDTGPHHLVGKRPARGPEP